MSKKYDLHSYNVAGVLIPETRILVITGYEDIFQPSRRAPRPTGGVGGDGRDTE